MTGPDVTSLCKRSGLRCHVCSLELQYPGVMFAPSISPAVNFKHLWVLACDLLGSIVQSHMVHFICARNVTDPKNDWCSALSAIAGRHKARPLQSL